MFNGFERKEIMAFNMVINMGLMFLNLIQSFYSLYINELNRNKNILRIIQLANIKMFLSISFITARQIITVFQFF